MRFNFSFGHHVRKVFFNAFNTGHYFVAKIKSCAQKISGKRFHIEFASCDSYSAQGAHYYAATRAGLPEAECMEFLSAADLRRMFPLEIDPP